MNPAEPFEPSEDSLIDMTSLDEETIGGLNRHFSDGLNDVINDERSGLMSHHSENSSEDQHAHSKSHVYSLFDLGGELYPISSSVH